MSEWVEFVEQSVHELDYGLQEEAARLLLDDCIACDELTNYQAHRIYMNFVDNRGFS